MAGALYEWCDSGVRATFSVHLGIDAKHPNKMASNNIWQKKKKCLICVMQIIIIRIKVCIGRIAPQITISSLVGSVLLGLPLASRLGAFDTQFFVNQSIGF